jgi:hypothetical protein
VSSHWFTIFRMSSGTAGPPACVRRAQLTVSKSILFILFFKGCVLLVECRLDMLKKGLVETPHFRQGIVQHRPFLAATGVLGIICWMDCEESIQASDPHPTGLPVPRTGNREVEYHRAEVVTHHHQPLGRDCLLHDQ